MLKKILFLILFLGINTIFYEINGSPPSNSNLMQEEMITANLIKDCLGKILHLDRHYWYFFASEIAQELSANPSLWNSTNNHYIPSKEREEFLSQLLRDLQAIAKSSVGTHPLKQKFAGIAKTIYEQHYSHYRQEKSGYYSYNLFLSSI